MNLILQEPAALYAIIALSLLLGVGVYAIYRVLKYGA